MIQKKILTENPYEELWSQLGYFENQQNCEKYLRRKHNLPNIYFRKYRASFLKYYIKQAREYFNSSSDVTLLTQPTVLYYGAVCLSEALFIAKNGYQDNTISHGLKDYKNRNINNISDFKIKISTKGTFSEFYKTIESKNFTSFQKIKHSEWTLKELLSMIPEVMDSYEDIYNQKSQVIKIQIIKDKIGDYIKCSDELLIKNGNEWTDEFIDKIKGFNDYYLPHVYLSDSSIRSFKKPQKKGDITQKNLMGEEYLISSIEKSGNLIYIPEMALHLMILYALSMLSRYHIDLWSEGSLELEKTEFFLIKHFLRVSIRKFPNLIYNCLQENEYIFTPELYKPLKTKIDEGNIPQIEEIIEKILKEKEEAQRTEESLREEDHDLWD